MIKVKKTVEVVYSVNEYGLFYIHNNKSYFIDWQTIVDNAVEQEIKTFTNDSEVFVRQLGKDNEKV